MYDLARERLDRRLQADVVGQARGLNPYRLVRRLDGAASSTTLRRPATGAKVVLLPSFCLN